MSEKLLKLAKQRLKDLAKDSPIKDKSLKTMMEEKGIKRRDFMKWSLSMTAMLSLPASFTPLVAKAAELADRLPLIWLHMAECTGCSESLIRATDPSVETLIFDYVSLEYHETLMAASGWQADENLHNAMKNYKGKYLLAVEGGIPSGSSDFYLTLGGDGKTGESIAKLACDSAAAIFAIGTCSSFGGIQAAYPNPTNAKPLSQITNKPVINVPGCPPNERNIVGTLVYFILFGALPSLDAYNRPKWAYGLRIHDLCERRGRFDAGEFVQSFGDDGAKKGYCLYKVGCKGPYTFNNCSKLRFNQGTSWPVMGGHGCIGCSEPSFWDNMGPFEQPVANRLYNTTFGGKGADNTADTVGITLLGAVGIGIAIHAVASSVNKGEKND